MVTCSPPLLVLLSPIVICSPGVTLPRFRTISPPLAAEVGLAAGCVSELVELADAVESPLSETIEAGGGSVL
jgi:hypothetical protein